MVPATKMDIGVTPHRRCPIVLTGRAWKTSIMVAKPRLYKNRKMNESMVSLVLRQYMRGENGTESLVGIFSNVVVQWRCGLSCLFE